MPRFSDHPLLRHMKTPSGPEATLRDADDTPRRIRFKDGQTVPIKTSTRIGFPERKAERDV